MKAYEGPIVDDLGDQYSLSEEVEEILAEALARAKELGLVSCSTNDEKRSTGDEDVTER